MLLIVNKYDYMFAGYFYFQILQKEDMKYYLRIYLSLIWHFIANASILIVNEMPIFKGKKKYFV